MKACMSDGQDGRQELPPHAALEEDWEETVLYSCPEEPSPSFFMHYWD
jgi:hypothetical protein